MPAALSYPGVYIEEVPSGVRTIVGVSTSVAAFVGYTSRGPTSKAVQVFNPGDFDRTFGGLHRDSDVSYAVRHFFFNKGSTAWIVRVARGAVPASVELKNGVAPDSPAVLHVTAHSEGIWGNNLRLDVDYDTINPASLFNLTVTELVERNGNFQPSRMETHRNLSMSSYSGTYVESVVNAASDLILVSRPGSVIALVEDAKATSTSGPLTVEDLDLLDEDHRRLAITLDGEHFEFDIFGDDDVELEGDSLEERLVDLAGRIRDKVQNRGGSRAFLEFDCDASDGPTETTGVILATSGTPAGDGERSSVRFTNASHGNAAAVLKLGIGNGGREEEAAHVVRPAQTGTVSSDLSALDPAALPASAEIRLTTLAPGREAEDPHLLRLWHHELEPHRPSTLQELQSRLQAALAGHAKAEFKHARVTLVDSRLRIVAGGASPDTSLQFAVVPPATAGGTEDDTASEIGLAGAGTRTNVTRYALGVGATAGAQDNAVSGNDGTPELTAADLKGSRAAKTGLYALENADLFNILCIPNRSDDDLLSEAVAYAGERRAFLLIDLPDAVDTFEKAKEWINERGSLRNPNAAVYFPQVMAADPLDENRLSAFPNCGAVAGVFARTDAARGVWKAPAGLETILAGVRALKYVLSDGECGVLNQLGVNCLRTMPAAGPVVWGARTLVGADRLASEWKYVPVRRLALFIEESLYRGTQWVVFEPNDEPLWSQIRLSVGSFMNNLFRQGAFQGQSPRQAYLVKCDAETTTQNDIDLGIVNIIVGFAPLKPAEFVIIKLQQSAGQVQV